MRYGAQLKASNTLAARMIVAQKYPEAYEVLQKAMGLAADFRIEEKGGATLLMNNASMYRIVALTEASTPIDSTNAIFPWPLVFSSPAQADRENAVSLDELTCLSEACALALFNMALSCQLSSLQKTCPAVRKMKLLAQAENLYLQSFEVGMYLDLPLLVTSLFMNLMDIYFERGDLISLHLWIKHFRALLRRLPENLPSEVFCAIVRADFYHSLRTVVARAA